MDSHDYRYVVATLRVEADAVRGIRALLHAHDIGDSWRGPVRWQAELAVASLLARISSAVSALDEAEAAVLKLWRESLNRESLLG